MSDNNQNQQGPDDGWTKVGSGGCPGREQGRGRGRGTSTDWGGGNSSSRGRGRGAGHGGGGRGLSNDRGQGFGSASNSWRGGAGGMGRGQSADSRRVSDASNIARPNFGSNSPLRDARGHGPPGNLPGMGRGQRPDSRGSYRSRGTRSPSPGHQGADIFDGGDHNPSQEVTTLENQIIQPSKSLVEKFKGLDLKDSQLCSKDGQPGDTCPLPPRPGYGNRDKVSLWANYFEMRNLEKVVLFQHVVSIDRHPSIAMSVRVRRRIFALLLKSDQLKKRTAATNYKDKLICTEELPQCELNVRYFEEEEGSSSGTSSYRVKIRFDKRLPLANLITDLQSPSGVLPADDKNESIQALNIVLAHFPNHTTNVQSVGQAKHFVLGTQKWDLGGGLNATRGFFHSARPSTGRMLLNLNVSTGAFYHDGPLQDLITAFGRKHQYTSPAKWAILLNNFVRKLRVKIRHMKQNGKLVVKVKTISGMKIQNGILGTADSVTFAWVQHPGGARDVSVKNYFMQAYQMAIDPNDNVVNVGSRDDVFLPVSVCEVLPGQSARQTLSAEQTTAMIRVACRKPADNARNIERDGLKLMGIGGDFMAPSKFGVEVSHKMLAVNGIMLRPPEITYDGKGVQFSGSWKSGSWNLAETKRFDKPGTKLSSAKLNVGYLIVDSPTDHFNSTVKNFMKELGKILRGHGISWPGEDYQYRRYEVRGNDVKNSEAVKRIFGQAVKDNIGFLIVILSSRDAEVYSQIKFQGDFQSGINTCCVRPIRRKPVGPKEKPGIGLNLAPGYLTNLALKINLKLGGVNQRLTLGNLLDQDTMYIGIDVTHPTGNDSMPEAPSIAGVVANSDNLLGQWPASIRTQGHRVEIVQQLADMIKERLAAWKGSEAPKKIIVYRDGVSETQYDQVVSQELPQIHEALAAKFTSRPPVTVVVVGKRHHTRFYPVRAEEALPNSNVRPGTVVDRGCTMERKFDFFMVAHEGIQGTSRPAHYVVVHDENKMSADQLQEMTYKLCYLYGRASRSVSIVPPAYYADILCERGRNYLYGVYHCRNRSILYHPSRSPWIRGVHNNLADTMFYI